MSRFRTLRGRLAALALASAAVAVIVPVVLFNLLLTSNLRSDVASRLRSQAAAASTTVSTEGGRIRVRESPSDGAIDSQVWVYSGQVAILRPRDHPETQHAADDLAGRSRAFVTLEGREVRLYSLGIRYRGRQIGTVVAAQSLDPYKHATEVSLVGSVVLALVLLSIVYAMTWFALGRALAPVEDMTRSAATWSEEETERRFGARDRPEELARLASTFDGLLERLSASLRHEQRFSAEISHELRTPLARIVAEMDLLQARERPAEERSVAYAAIARSADQMNRILETLMTAARAESRAPQGRTDLGVVLQGLADEWHDAFTGEDAALEVSLAPEQIVVGVDPGVVERVVAPLLENAHRHAATRVELGSRRENGGAVVTVRDDGAGVPAAERELIFEPGVRGTTATDDGGAGLGLALSRRLARSAGGDVAVGGAADGGAVFTVHLPL